MRYCCEKLKETGGVGRRVLTGVRWAESVNRANNAGLIKITTQIKKTQKLADRGGYRITPTDKGGVILNNDNEETRRFMETCIRKQKVTVNPIIDWTDSDVWEFIHEYNVPYCGLYDQGAKRLGCIGCPMNHGTAAELEKYPKYKENYLKAFDRMIQANRKKGIKMSEQWKDAEGVMKWWLQQ